MVLAVFGGCLLGAGVAHAAWRWEFAFDWGFDVTLSGVDVNGVQDPNLGEVTNRSSAFEYRFNGVGQSINTARGRVTNETNQFASFEDFPCDVWHPLDDAFGPSTQSYQAVSRNGRTILVCAGSELY